MISRREFMKWASVSAIVPFVAAKLGPLQPPWVQYLPLVMAPYKPPPTQTPLRIALNNTLSWGRMTYPPTDEESKRKLELLDYFAALGYSHVFYFLDFKPESFGRDRSGRWVYNQGNYGAGDIAESFKAMKRAVEDPPRRMRLIPAKESLSHMEGFIEMDPSISEFTGPDAYERWLEETGLEAWLEKEGKNTPKNHVAFVGDNPGMDQIFAEYLRIILSNWGDTDLGGKFPAYIHIGHDELGVCWACCIKADRSKGLGQTRSELVAAEINRRLAAIRHEVSPATQVMVYGDSFLPADFGETYDMAGDLQTGEGGVLQTLRDKYGVADKLIMLPWIYSYPDGYFDRDARMLAFNKVKQIAFLDRLGIRYIPGTGEDGGSDRFTEWKTERVKQTTFEWVRASQMFPKYLAGFAHLGWTELTCDSSTGFCHDYNANLLAYLAWTYGERSLMLARRNSYGPRIFSRVRSGLSSQSQDWMEGVHYSRPPLQGSLLTMAGS